MAKTRFAGSTFRSLRLLTAVGGILLLASIASPALAQSIDCTIVSRSASGPDAAAIQATIDAFRSELGDDNGLGGSYPTGRRELTWDGYPSAAPSVLRREAFRPWGVLLSSGARNERYQVSAGPGSGSTPPRFGNIDPLYPTIFQTFSGEQLFTPLGSNVIGLEFLTPNRFKPATVRQFGAVFADVDPGVQANTYMVFYGTDGALLGTVAVPPFSRGLSFAAGIAPCQRIGRVKIQLGTAAIDASAAQGDVVVMDNVIYSEPRPVHSETLDFDGDGKTDFAIYRPSNGGWYIRNTGSATTETAIWGLPGDIPVPGDYDGDGRTDFAAYRPGTGEWLFLARPPQTAPSTQVFGLQGDIPVPFDYDHDGKVDIAVWRPSSGGFYIKRSSLPFGGPVAIHWGQPGDIPLLGKQ